MTSTGHEPTYTWSEVQKQIETAVKHDRKQRTWVGLTKKDIDKAWEWAQKSSPYGVTRIEVFAKELEATLKEKNT